MVDPADVDPSLKYSINAWGIQPLPTPRKAIALLAKPVSKVLEHYRMIAGCAIDGSDAEYATVDSPASARQLIVIVLRFPDEPTASVVASKIDSTDSELNSANVAVSVDGYPNAHAHWRPGLPTMAASIAHGPYVVSLLLRNQTADQQALTGLARTAFDKQLPMLDHFSATPEDRFQSLPLDQDGMLRRLVPYAPNRWPYPAVVAFSNTTDATLSQEGSVNPFGLVFEGRAARLWYRVTYDTGVDAIAENNFTQLYRHFDTVKARKHFNTMLQKLISNTAQQRLPDIPGADDTACFSNPSLQDYAQYSAPYTCITLYGRYIGILLGRDKVNTQHRIAAQYGLLMNTDSE
ncbi:hypothetical protein NRB20_24930 [Nocardia sp. RB20]|uniref:Uncharacterized protein n=1 Tax=Nocardia macrotermitis TaxID=2585198 RepID=A0A7K0D388_9NOCA|nr:hypothetical protein [Nocardia macrotermitis]MQY19404.1 hypothetical protein [Nocardia macrotermitis]